MLRRHKERHVISVEKPNEHLQTGGTDQQKGVNTRLQSPPYILIALRCDNGMEDTTEEQQVQNQNKALPNAVHRTHGEDVACLDEHEAGGDEADGERQQPDADRKAHKAHLLCENDHQFVVEPLGEDGHPDGEGGVAVEQQHHGHTGQRKVFNLVDRSVLKDDAEESRYCHLRQYLLVQLPAGWQGRVHERLYQQTYH